MYKILYPERRTVTEEWVRSRYADLMANEFIREHKLNLDEPGDANRLDAHYSEWKREDLTVAMEALEDAGIVTFENRTA